MEHPSFDELRKSSVQLQYILDLLQVGLYPGGRSADVLTTGNFVRSLKQEVDSQIFKRMHPPGSGPHPVDEVAE